LFKGGVPTVGAIGNEPIQYRTLYLTGVALTPGEVITDVMIGLAVQITTAGSTLTLGMYDSAVDPVTGAIHPNTLIATFGAVPMVTNGQKIITGVGLTLPATVNNFYWWAFLRTVGVGTTPVNPSIRATQGSMTPGYFVQNNPASAAILQQAWACLRGPVGGTLALPATLTTAALNSYVQSIGFAPAGGGANVPQIFYRQ
jgi:hypothetical protein